MGYNKSSMSEFTFPDEIKELMNNITDEKEWKILEFLIQTDNELSYTQLRKKLEISENRKNVLTYHLKELQKAGWLRNWLKKGTESTDRQKSYYSITEFGLKIIEGSMKAMEMNSYSTSTWLQLQETLQLPSTSKLNTTGITEPVAVGWSESIMADAPSFTFTNAQRDEARSTLVNYTNTSFTYWTNAIMSSIIKSSEGLVNPLETITRKKSRLRSEI